MGKRLLLSLVSLAVTLLAAEAVLRVAGIGRAGRGSSWFAGGNHPRFLFEENAATGYALRPGFRGREIATSGEFSTTVEIDERGMRREPEPRGSGPLVLAVGDSMTFGEGVEAAATWTARLGELRAAPVENGGVPGYSSRQMALRARRLAADLHPALVLMVFLPQWDLGRCADPFVYRDGYIVAGSYADRLVLIGDGLYLRDTRLPVLGTLSAWAQGYTNLGRALIPRLHELVAPARERRDDTLLEHWRAAWKTSCLPAIVDLDHALAASGSRLLVVFIDTVNHANQRDQRFARQALAESGVEVERLDDLLPAGTDHTALHYPTDQHWNPRGHAAVAAALLPVVQARLAAAAR